MEFTTTVEIAADTATIWAALGDPTHWPTWLEGVTEVTPTTPGARPAYGTEYHLKAPWYQMNDQDIQIREYEPEHRLTYLAATPVGAMTFDYTLRPLADGHVAVDHMIRMEGLVAKMTGLVGGIPLETQLVKEAAQLRDHCERLVAAGA